MCLPAWELTKPREMWKSEMAHSCHSCVVFVTISFLCMAWTGWTPLRCSLSLSLSHSPHGSNSTFKYWFFTPSVSSVLIAVFPVSLRITNSFLLTSFRPENYVAQTARLPADIKYETLKVYQHDTRIFLSLILSLALPYLKKYRNRKEDIRFKILQILCEL